VHRPAAAAAAAGEAIGCHLQESIGDVVGLYVNLLARCLRAAVGIEVSLPAARRVIATASVKLLRMKRVDGAIVIGSGPGCERRLSAGRAEMIVCVLERGLNAHPPNGR
jgi:hypothetical protein